MSKLPEVIHLLHAEIREARQKLYYLINPINDDQASMPPPWGGWSINQVLDHHHKLVSRTVYNIRELLINSDPYPITTLDEVEIAIPSLDSKLECPSELLPNPDSNKFDLLKRLEFAQVGVIDLIGQLSVLDAAHLSCAIVPYLPNLNLYQLLRFIAIHEQRHCTQVEAILTVTRNEVEKSYNFY